MVNNIAKPCRCPTCGLVDEFNDFEDGYCYDCRQMLPYCDAEPCGGRVTTPGEFLCDHCAELVRRTGVKS